MSDNSHIEWTDATWNPVTGCTRVSPGCDNCYAVTMTKRLAAMGQEKYQGLVNEGKGHFNGVVKCHPDEMEKPLRWRKPRRIFVNSMSDLFHERVPVEFIGQVFETMAVAHWHDFQILTKRPDRASILSQDPKLIVWPDNVWIGTSVENQAAADERIPHLLRIPAAVRWLSMEPLLGPVNIGFGLTLAFDDWRQRAERIHWVVTGGESGPGARPMHPDWARSIRDQCVQAGVAFHFKQHGAWISGEDIDSAALMSPQMSDPDDYFYRYDFDDVCMWRVGKKKAGRLLDGREWNGHPFELEVSHGA